MRNLTAKFGLTLAVLVGSVGMSWGADFQKGMTAAQSGDYATALREWTPLAEQGDANAQFKLGSMYQQGIGVPKDNKIAIKWLTLVVKQGFSNVHASLGKIFAFGLKTPDYNNALKW